MLEPGYDYEGACKARLCALFKKTMPELVPAPEHAGEQCGGVEAHSARTESMLGALGAVPGLSSSRVGSALPVL